MTLPIRMTQGIMKTIDHNDTIITTGIINVISETAHDQLVASRDTVHNTQVNSETVPAIVLIAHSHQVVLSLEIDAHVLVTNILVPMHL